MPIIDNKELEVKNAALIKKLEEVRTEWSGRLSKLIEMVRNIDMVIVAQVDMLSYRHMIVDKISEFQNMTYKLNVKYDMTYKIIYRGYFNNYDLKLSGSEKDRFAKADLSLLKQQINIIESHIDFYKECIRTLDNMGFAIKRRIDIATNEI